MNLEKTPTEPVSLHASPHTFNDAGRYSTRDRTIAFRDPISRFSTLLAQYNGKGRLWILTNAQILMVAGGRIELPTLGL